MMEYGQIAESKKINYAIYRCFDHLCEKDQQSFVKKFHEQPHDSDQIMHTFRELVVGAYLSSRDFQARHEYPVESKTPDWCILDDRLAVIAIVELVNFHIDRATESEIERQRQAKSIAFYFRDGNKSNVERLYNCLWDKMRKYQALVGKLRVPYIIAIFPAFEAVVDFGEIRACLYDNGAGLFHICRDVSGVLYFYENGGQYYFKYEQNPNALRVFDIPGGVLSLSPGQASG